MSAAKRVVFVDDEEPALAGLRISLRRSSTQWDMRFIEGGVRALAALETQPCDVIVTDMRMPGMDGAQLLKQVNERWPATIRIVLSGCSDLERTIRLAPVAHQYLAKPCEARQIQSAVQRCLDLQDLLRGSDLRALVGGIRQLPTVPGTYARLQVALASDEISVPAVAKIIAEDAAISAKVLQMVNSAFFRLARRITNIEQGVAYLGFVAVRNLVLSAEVFSQWPANMTVGGQSFLQMQGNVHKVAAAAASLTLKTPIADDTLLASLLHDIGYWILAQERPAELAKAHRLAAETGIALHEAETQIMGASHAEIGAYLLGLWGLPYSVVEAVALHHAPHRVGDSDFDVLAALVVGHAIVHADPGIDDRYLKAVRAPFEWSEAVRRVGDGADAGARL